MKQHKYTVSGTGEFPFDMLRFESCWPNDKHDAANLGTRSYRRVTLLGPHAPDVKRWKAYGWIVIV